MNISKITGLSIVILLSMSVTAQAARCKDYRNCRQAVIAWCAGEHPRADRDGDGIPCENVCRSRMQVKSIMKEIGCSR